MEIALHGDRKLYGPSKTGIICHALGARREEDPHFEGDQKTTTKNKTKEEKEEAHDAMFQKDSCKEVRTYKEKQLWFRSFVF